MFNAIHFYSTPLFLKLPCFSQVTPLEIQLSDDVLNEEESLIGWKDL